MNEDRWPLNEVFNLLVEQMSSVSFAEGGSKKCSKGKSCGSTCINANDDCLLDFIPSISESLSKSSRFLSGLSKGKSAEEIERTLIQSFTAIDSTQKKAFTQFAALVREGKVTDAELKQVAELIASVTLTPKQEDRGAARVMSYEEVKSIHESGKLEKLAKAYDNSIKSGTFDPKAPGGMAEYVDKNVKVVEISDTVARLAYSMLPATTRDALNRAGSVKGEGQVYNGVDSQGNPIFGSSGNAERGVMIAKRWMEQDGRDPFTGRFIDIRAGEPEHLFSWSQAKDSGGKGDQPGNLAVAAPQTNNSKAAKGVDDDFRKWGEQVKNWYEMGPERYKKDVVDPKESAAGDVAAKRVGAPSEVEKAFSAATPKERVQMMAASAKAYGDRVRYLTIAAGLESGQWGQNIPGKRGARRQELDARAAININGKKLKPSTGVLVAAAALEPAERAKFLAEADKLRLARTPSTAEIKSYEGPKDPAYVAKMESLDREFESRLTQLIERTVPSFDSYL